MLQTRLLRNEGNVVEQVLRTVFLALLLSSTTLATGEEASNTRPAERLANEMFRRAESMVEHGREGHTHEIVKYGVMMVREAQELMKSLHKDNGEEDPALPYLNKAIVAGEKAVQEGEAGNQPAALKAARTALRYARLTRESLNSH